MIRKWTIDVLKVLLGVAVVVAAFCGAARGVECPPGDLDGDCRVDWADLAALAECWPDPNCPVDLDGVAGVDMADFAVMAAGWLDDARTLVEIRWLGHAAFRLADPESVIYIDPRNIPGTPHDATLILVTHTHGDHFSVTDINKVKNAQTQIVAPADVIATVGGQAIAPGQTLEVGPVRITGVAAYNVTIPNHPRSKNWVGFVIGMGTQRIYNAGDTDLTDEMKALRDIDVAVLPVGGTYTMTALQAAQATTFIRPRMAIPAHWGSIVGTLADAQTFAANAACDVTIMSVGQTLTFGP